MNEEIRESIKHIQDIVDFYKLNDENNYDYSDKDLISMKTLLDYITNLQEENQKLVNVIEELEKYCKEEIEEGNKMPAEYERYGLNGYVKGSVGTYERILNKLTELKGGSDDW